MKGSTAGIAFLIICLALAALLILKILTSILTAVLFAMALITLGLASKGFKHNGKNKI